MYISFKDYIFKISILYTIGGNISNQLVQACRDRNMVHAYVNTPATEKLAIEV